MGDSVIGLVDIRSMFVSCERVFQPRLRGRPVVTLSNNDGCVVARSAEAAELGVVMGQPWFQLMWDPRYRTALTATSSNYALYGDMSSRFYATLRTIVADIEVYSIDECFVRLPAADATRLMEDIQERVDQWLGLPVSVGVARTKTLAKIAQRLAKAEVGQHGRLNLTTWSDVELTEALAGTPVCEVWGIGRRLTKRLSSLGIYSAADLAAADPARLRRIFGVTVERTARELAGTPCIEMGPQPHTRDQIIHSRMLGTPVTTRAAMRDVLTVYATRAARRMRSKGLEAHAVTSSFSTSWFGREPISKSHHTRLPHGACDAPAIIEAAHQVLDLMVEGHPYNRAGIMLSGLQPIGATPLLVDDSRGRSHRAVGAAIDAITTKWGENAVGYGAAGVKQAPSWAMKREALSPEWTTRWDQIPVLDARVRHHR